jgi:hypothetical protein
MTGNVAPIANVGGNKHAAATNARMNTRSHPDLPTCVKALDERHGGKKRESAAANRQFERCVNTEWMSTKRNETRRVETSEAHATHEHPEQHTERHRRRTDHELQ